MPAKIIIQRKKEFLNRMRSVAVRIDGADLGPVKSGTAEEYPLEPGIHKVACRLSRYNSREMEVTVDEGETKFLCVRMGMKYFGLMYIILLLTIFSEYLPKLAGFPRPEWWPWVKLAIIIPVMLYFFYYLTIGRKNYLVLEEDNNNIFH